MYAFSSEHILHSGDSRLYKLELLVIVISNLYLVNMLVKPEEREESVYAVYAGTTLLGHSI